MRAETATVVPSECKGAVPKTNRGECRGRSVTATIPGVDGLTRGRNRVTQRPMSERGLAWVLVFIASSAVLAGCRDAPDVVLASARNALQSRDEAGFLGLLEPRAAAFLRTVPSVVSKSGRVFKILRDGKPGANLLPKGDVVDVVETGPRAVVVKVRQGKMEAKVPMRLVEGQWRIDLLEMDSFYQQIRPGE